MRFRTGLGILYDHSRPIRKYEALHDLYYKIVCKKFGLYVRRWVNICIDKPWQMNKKLDEPLMLNSWTVALWNFNRHLDNSRVFKCALPCFWLLHFSCYLIRSPDLMHGPLRMTFSSQASDGAEQTVQCSTNLNLAPLGEMVHGTNMQESNYWYVWPTEPVTFSHLLSLPFSCRSQSLCCDKRPPGIG